MKKERIKAIVFDIAGVVYLDDYQGVYTNLAKIFKFSLTDFNKARENFFLKSQLGKVSAGGYELSIAKQLELKDKMKFAKKWISLREKAMKPNKKLINLIKRLDKTYLLATLTNVMLATEKLRQKKKIYRFFRVNIVSCKVGMSKPNKNIYLLLLKKLKIPAREIIFIDDSKINLKPAKKLGMKTILFKNNKQLVKDLRKLGVKI
jgi:epoxide hydrolase-like predicted phosphatase